MSAGKLPGSVLTRCDLLGTYCPRTPPACLLITTTYKRSNAFGRQGPEVRIFSPRPVIRKKAAFAKNKRPYFVGWAGFGTESKVRTEARSADRRTTNRQEADLDERATRVRPKGHAQEARGQLRPAGPSGKAASPSSHPDQLFPFAFMQLVCWEFAPDTSPIAIVAAPIRSANYVDHQRSGE